MVITAHNGRKMMIVPVERIIQMKLPNWSNTNNKGPGTSTTTMIKTKNDKNDNDKKILTLIMLK